jgi:SSS family solute:Na+ symporter
MIDNLIVAIYLILILLVGLHYRSKSESLKGYGAFSNSNKFILVATIFAAAVGGGTTFGLAEKAFTHNLAYSYGILLTIPVDILIAFILIPKLTKYHGSISAGDIIAKYYGNTGRVITGIGTLFVSIGYLAAQINVSGRIFQYILDIEKNHSVILSYVMVIIYTAIGGLRSVVFTNILQFIAMLLAIPIITFVGISATGVGNIILSIKPEQYLLNNSELISGTIYAALGFSVMGFYPSFIQRTVINKNSETVKSAIIIKSIIYAFFIICITINGLLAFVIDPLQNSALAVPNMIDLIMPIGIKGLVICGLLAAVTSTASSDLNIASISIINDIFRPISHIYSPHILLRLAQIMTVIIGSSAIIIALSFDHVVDLVIFSASFWSPMILVPLIACLFDIKVPLYAFITCTFVGLSSFVIWEYLALIPSLKGVFVGTLANFICFIAFKKILEKSSRTS